MTLSALAYCSTRTTEGQSKERERKKKLGTSFNEAEKKLYNNFIHASIGQHQKLIQFPKAGILSYDSQIQVAKSNMKHEVICLIFNKS